MPSTKPRLSTIMRSGPHTHVHRRTPWGTRAREIHEACERASCRFLVFAGAVGIFALMGTAASLGEFVALFL